MLPQGLTAYDRLCSGTEQVARLPYTQGLAQLMGDQLLEHTNGLQPVLQQRVQQAVTDAGSRS